ncbi:Suppressor of Sensor Kinase (SLN1) [Quaeritorhiza haematococci]|nr:Suppressor of Sensor Kinase (SLN1) [Quaeritorhiza haematococci]
MESTLPTIESDLEPYYAAPPPDPPHKLNHTLASSGTISDSADILSSSPEALHIQHSQSPTETETYTSLRRPRLQSLILDRYLDELAHVMHILLSPEYHKDPQHHQHNSTSGQSGDATTASPPASNRSRAFFDNHADLVRMNLRRKFPKWILGDFLGAGTLGMVFRAVHPDTGEVLFAVKQATIDQFQIPTTEMFVRVNNILTLIDHPNIIKYYGCEVLDGKTYTFMDYCDGGSLHDQIYDPKRNPDGPGIRDMSTVQKYTKQALKALEFLHRHDILHRDIKPSNFMVKEGVIKLADFATAKLQYRCCDRDHLNKIEGTPCYIAPELITTSASSRRNEALTGSRRFPGIKINRGAQDIWSLGCCVFEMFIGKPPWYQLDNMWSLYFMVGIWGSRVDDMKTEIPHPSAVPNFEITETAEDQPKPADGTCIAQKDFSSVRSRLLFLGGDVDDQEESFVTFETLFGRENDSEVSKDDEEGEREGDDDDVDSIETKDATPVTSNKEAAAETGESILTTLPRQGQSGKERSYSIVITPPPESIHPEPRLRHPSNESSISSDDEVVSNTMSSSSPPSSVASSVFSIPTMNSSDATLSTPELVAESTSSLAVSSSASTLTTPATFVSEDDVSSEVSVSSLDFKEGDKLKPEFKAGNRKTKRDSSPNEAKGKQPHRHCLGSCSIVNVDCIKNAPDVVNPLVAMAIQSGRFTPKALDFL